MGQRSLLVVPFLFLLGFSVNSAQDASRLKSEEAGRSLRLQAFSISPEKLGLHPSPEFPRIFGVIVDWPIGDNFATTVSLADGTSSLYTTSAFGIIGGGFHEPVRKATLELIRYSDGFFDDSKPVSTYLYPDKTHIRFYLLTYHGVRMIEAEYDSIYTGKDKYSNFFGASQSVLSQLRLISDKK